MIGCGQFARYALEGGIGCEEDPLAHLADIRLATVFLGGHRFECSRDELDRSRQIVVVEHRLQDAVDDDTGDVVEREGRIEARFGGSHRDAQRLVGNRGMRTSDRERCDQAPFHQRTQERYGASLQTRRSQYRAARIKSLSVVSSFSW